MSTNYTEMTNKELFTLCQKRTIQGVTGKSKKADLISALETYDKEHTTLTAEEIKNLGGLRKVAEGVLEAILTNAEVTYSKNSDGIMIRKDGKAFFRIQVRKTYYQLTASKTFAEAHEDLGFEYHAGWNMKYATKVSLNQIKTLVGIDGQQEESEKKEEA